MEQLTERQKHIFMSLVESYVESAQPVGSRTLMKQKNISFSPATIRNEMSDLEALGFVTHPHTSAGRVPTDKGYRFYVNAVTRDQEEEVDIKLAEQVMQHFPARMKDLDELIEFTSGVLSTLSEQAALVSYPEPGLLYFGEIELIPLANRRVLIMWVSTNGLVGHRMVEVDEPVTAALCQKVSRLLNTELKGKKFSEMQTVLLHKLRYERDKLRDVYELARKIIRLASGENEPVFKFSGSRRLLEKPEFQNVDALKRIFSMLEEAESKLARLFRQDLEDASIHVHIGEENPASMRDCSIIAAPYAVKGQAVGMVAVVGPRRMPYRRMIRVVHYVARSFSEHFEHFIL